MAPRRRRASLVLAAPAGALRLEPVGATAKDPAAPKLTHGAGFAGEDVGEAAGGGRRADRVPELGSDGTSAPGEHVKDSGAFAQSFPVVYTRVRR